MIKPQTHSQFTSRPRRFIVLRSEVFALFWWSEDWIFSSFVASGKDWILIFLSARCRVRFFSLEKVQSSARKCNWSCWFAVDDPHAIGAFINAHCSSTTVITIIDDWERSGHSRWALFTAIDSPRSSHHPEHHCCPSLPLSHAPFLVVPVIDGYVSKVYVLIFIIFHTNWFLIDWSYFFVSISWLSLILFYS